MACPMQHAACHPARRRLHWSDIAILQCAAGAGLQICNLAGVWRGRRRVMFVSTTTAGRIERAEAECTRATVAAIARSGRAPAAFTRALDGGVAAFVRVGSPMNKVI